jgi:PAS domain S-box-containing protein
VTRVPVLQDYTPPRGVSRHLEYIANRVPVLLAYIGADGTLEYANRAYEEWFGTPRKQILGQTLAELVGQKTYDALLRPHIAAALSGRIASFVGPLGRTASGPRYVEATFVPHVAGDGSVAGFVSHIADITGLRQHEEARDQVISVLGHDLRNPLSTVLVLVRQLLEAKDVGVDLLRCASRIAASAKRMDRILDDLIDFSRGRFAHGIPVSRVPTDLEVVSRRVLDELRVLHPERVVTLEVDGDLRGVWDPGRIGQLVSNLVSNAIKHGVGPVSVTARGGTGDVSIEVHNGGAPIPSDLLATLFYPFVSRSPDNSGLGLGLYIVSEIVRAHRGAIDVQSADETGTAFLVRLPRVVIGEGVLSDEDG